ncbi:MAG TPA: hypothetical protein VII06_36460 [Chloroflexota bacterium]|jgi:hypothetical protein
MNIVDLDELWPPTRDLIGLLFDSEQDFKRCLSLVDEDPDAFRIVNWKEPSMVVRKRDLPRLVAAGLVYTEVELTDPDTLSPEERRQIEWEMIHSEEVQRRMAEMLRRPLAEP